jgi:hypothetical protein
VRRESKFGGKIQTQLGSDIGIVNIGQDVPHIFATSLQMAQIKRYGDGPMRDVKHTGIQQLNWSDQAAIGVGRGRSKVR